MSLGLLRPKHAGRHRRVLAARAGQLRVWLSVSGSPVHPAFGHPVIATCTIENTGQLPANYSLLGYLYLAGTQTAEGHLGNPAPNPATGSITGGASATVTLTSGNVDYYQNISGYNPSAGLDAVFVLTDETTGATGSFTVPSGVFLPSQPAPPPPPPAPASFQVALNSFSSSISCGGYGSAVIAITNTGQVAATATVTGTTYIPSLTSSPEGYWTQKEVTVNPGTTAYVNMQTSGPMQLCGYSGYALFSIVGANAIQNVRGDFTTQTAATSGGSGGSTSGGSSGGTTSGSGTTDPCASVQQQYNSLGSQIMNIRIQLSTMSPSDPNYQSLVNQWNSLAQQQSDLVTNNPSCF